MQGLDNFSMRFTNGTLLDGEYAAEWRIGFRVAAVCTATLSSVLNAVVFRVLLIPPITKGHLCLLYLSAIEIAFSLIVIPDVITTCRLFVPEESIPEAVETAIYIFSDWFMCSKNLWIAWITLARCFLILNPMTFSRKITKKLHRVLFATLFTFALCASLIRNMVVTKVVSVLFFTVQSGIPVPVVCVTTVCMTVSLVLKVHDTVGQRTGRRRRRATKLLLALAISFSCSQLPVFILIILHASGAIDEDHKEHLLEISIVNLVTIMNSFLNFFIMFAVNPEFRTSFKHLYLRRIAAAAPHHRPSSTWNGSSRSTHHNNQYCNNRSGAAASVGRQHLQRQSTAAAGRGTHTMHIRLIDHAK